MRLPRPLSHILCGTIFILVYGSTAQQTFPGITANHHKCSPPKKLLPFYTPDCHKVEVFSIASMPCSLRIPWNMPEGPQENLTVHLAQVRGGLSQAQESFHLVPDGCQLLKVLKSSLPTSSHTKDPAAIVIFL